MTVYARIENDRVAELVTTSGDIKTLFHNSWTFVDVTEVKNIERGWSAQQIQGQWLFNAPVPLSQDGLVTFAMRKQRVVASSGTAVNAGGLYLKVATDPTSLAHLATLVAMAQMTPTATFPWADDAGNVTMLTASQVATLNNQVVAFVQSTYQILSLMLAAIKSGKIVTRGQIENPPAPVPAWPKNN